MYQKHRWLYLLSAVLFVFVAVIILRNPVANLATIAIFLSISIVMSGIAQIVAFFALPKNMQGAMLLIWGILSVFIGVYILSGSYLELAGIIPYAFAFWISFSGISRIVYGVDLIRNNSQGVLFIVLGIVGMILGMAFFYHPLLSGLIVNYLVGSLFIYEAILCLLHFFHKINDDYLF